MKKINNPLGKQRMQAPLQFINDDETTTPKSIEKGLATPDQILGTVGFLIKSQPSFRSGMPMAEEVASRSDRIFLDVCNSNIGSPDQIKKGLQPLGKIAMCLQCGDEKSDAAAED